MVITTVYYVVGSNGCTRIMELSRLEKLKVSDNNFKYLVYLYT